MDKRKLKSRTRMQSALKALLTEHDLRSISIGDLCKEAKVTRPTFYANYRDLADMLDQYLEEILEELEALHNDLNEQFTPCSQQERTTRLIQILLENLDREDPRMQALFSTMPVVLPERRFSRLVLKLIEQSVEKDIAQMPPEKRLIVAHYFTGATLGIIRLWMQKPDAITPQQIANIFSELTF
ncbi:TetR-like C-terminal domain-containing protein [uncultured Cohaesibacter sp.]|uniref:TetR/AcrR family transcriptional regulator n=1 Tax=uncultured Cohaesibacter sp. TaxID=1002546 RepID=UPI002AAA85B8|nr:TetR-like C-terminal domain-containing protein [uncultured Cohaesibacter sp.]